MYTVASARADLLSRADLEARGLSSRAIEAAMANSVLRRVHHGWYVDARVWDAAYPEKRHLLRVVAAHAQQRGADVLSLAHVGCGPSRTAAVPANSAARAREWRGARRPRLELLKVARHRGRRARGRSDSRSTGSPAPRWRLTVADMSAVWPHPRRVCPIADAALRLAAWDDAKRSYDEGAAEDLRTRIRSRMERHARARGVRRRSLRARSRRR